MRYLIGILASLALVALISLAVWISRQPSPQKPNAVATQTRDIEVVRNDLDVENNRLQGLARAKPN